MLPSQGWLERAVGRSVKTLMSELWLRVLDLEQFAGSVILPVCVIDMDITINFSSPFFLLYILCPFSILFHLGSEDRVSFLRTVFLDSSQVPPLVNIFLSLRGKCSMFLQVRLQVSALTPQKRYVWELRLFFSSTILSIL